MPQKPEPNRWPVAPPNMAPVKKTPPPAPAQDPKVDRWPVAPPDPKRDDESLAEVVLEAVAETLAHEIGVGEDETRDEEPGK